MPRTLASAASVAYASLAAAAEKQAMPRCQMPLGAVTSSSGWIPTLRTRTLPQRVFRNQGVCVAFIAANEANNAA
jgi:hypothetical protein